MYNWPIDFCSIILQCLISIGWLMWVATWKLWPILQLVSCQARFSPVSMFPFQHPEKYSKAICCVASYPIATVWEMVKQDQVEGVEQCHLHCPKGRFSFQKDELDQQLKQSIWHLQPTINNRETSQGEPKKIRTWASIHVPATRCEDSRDSFAVTSSGERVFWNGREAWHHFKIRFK